MTVSTYRLTILDSSDETVRVKKDNQQLDNEKLVSLLNERLGYTLYPHNVHVIGQWVIHTYPKIRIIVGRFSKNIATSETFTVIQEAGLLPAYQFSDDDTVVVNGKVSLLKVAADRKRR